MDRLLLKGVLHEGRARNILIEGKRFKDLDAPAEVADAQVLDASGTAVLPALYNTHTHAAMTLLRGYADDMPLQKWLTEYIRPFEDKLTPEDIRKIVRIQMELLRSKLESENVSLSFTPAFEDQMVKDGYDPVFGARPVKRLIQRELVNKLAREILEGKIHKDSVIEVDCVDGQTVLRNK